MIRYNLKRYSYNYHLVVNAYEEITFNKMIGFKVLFVAVVCLSTIEANTLWKIAVNTAACDDCGMSNTFGALRMQVCNTSL